MIRSSHKLLGAASLGALISAATLAPAPAQEGYTLRLTNPGASNEILELDGVAGTPTGPMEVAAELEIGAGSAGVHAWSFGVSHDPLVLDLVGASLEGTSGDVPDFATVDLVPGGAVTSVALGADPATVLPAGGTHVLLALEYSTLFPAKDTTVLGRLRFVDSLVGPAGPVATRVETSSGGVLTPVVPAQRTLLIFLTGFEYSSVFGLSLGPLNPIYQGTGGSTLAAYVRPGAQPTYGVLATLESSLPQTETQGAQGWSLSVAHDPDLLTVVSVTTAGTDAAAAFNGGFEKHDVVSGAPGDGVISAVVLSLVNPASLPPRGRSTLTRLDYQLIADTTVEGSRIETEVRFQDGLQGVGQPINNVVTFRGESHRPLERRDLVFDLTVGLPPRQPFRRGDPNNDARFDIADAIWIAGELFLRGPPTACVLAADANGDGNRDLSDVAFLLAYQFMGGPEPSAPFPACGVLEDQVDADCPLGSTSCAGP